MFARLVFNLYAIWRAVKIWAPILGPFLQNEIIIPTENKKVSIHWPAYQSFSFQNLTSSFCIMYTYSLLL